jgi:histidyl-tRNA synthetase
VSKLRPVRGTRDIWGDEARRTTRVVDCFRSVCERYGFEKISTPIFEFSEVFRRTLGETSDVVSKEMYTFEDRGGEEITLRPENTAGIARAYISEGMQQHGVVKLYAFGPMFRYERPQKGRYRQFYQLDAEIIGAAEPAADVELIALAQTLLEDLGVANQVRLELNSLGDAESRETYRAALTKYLKTFQKVLSKDSRARLDRNPLRILDSKDEGDHELLEKAPRMSDYLNDASKAFLKRVRVGLDEIGVAYKINDRLVRGLDYYTHTAFEFITTNLGAQGTVIGGGRYDGLIGQMGGPETPGTGWAGGIERLAMLVAAPPALPRPIVMIPLGDVATIKANAIAYRLRGKGLHVATAFRGNLKKRLARAAKSKARYAVILGDDELAKGVVTLRDLDSEEQKEIKLAQLEAELTPEP